MACLVDVEDSSHGSKIDLVALRVRKINEISAEMADDVARHRTCGLRTARQRPHEVGVPAGSGIRRVAGPSLCHREGSHRDLLSLGIAVEKYTRPLLPKCDSDSQVVLVGNAIMINNSARSAHR